jgi:glycosyltransferase involved in cell wall biosynthesis
LTSYTNPVVSVIVPARNEEACLALCLESLVSQTGIAFELIVVDDASTDRTAEIARSFAIPEREGTAFSRALPNSTLPTGNCCAVSVISAPPLPENWTGKNNAMSAGAKIAHTNAKWLLFTDADTVHKPGSLARAVAEAEQHGAALLSYSPEQEIHGFWEKAVMPVIFAELAATYPPKKVNDPASPIAAANGQYLMISREAYDAVGGHAVIANNLLEDVAMARLVKSSGRKIFFRYGGDAVRTRMYRSWSQMKEGWTKNLALLFPKPTELAWVRFWQFTVTLLLPPSLLRGAYWKPFLDHSYSAIFRWQSFGFAVFVHIVFVWWWIAYITRMRRSHCSWPSVARGFLGLPVFAYLLLRSHRACKNARFEWKDRSYIYGVEEIRDMTHAPSRGTEFRLWHRVVAWVTHADRE